VQVTEAGANDHIQSATSRTITAQTATNMTNPSKISQHKSKTITSTCNTKGLGMLCIGIFFNRS
jgi:hypothetical protein